ncbi:hypothetical protein EBZU44_47450 [Enterobacter cloacae]|nr:hypothetical protein EBZU44_47450 [Enterobacter cloacae]
MTAGDFNHAPPDDFPVVGGVSGTVTINLTNLPAGVGSEALVVPVEAVFNG